MQEALAELGSEGGLSARYLKPPASAGGVLTVKTYRDGNRGSRPACGGSAKRSISPVQVAVRVKVRAQELGNENYPSH